MRGPLPARSLRARADRNPARPSRGSNPSLELRSTTWDSGASTPDYVFDSSVIQLRVPAGPATARILYSEESLPTLTSGQQHTFLELGDHLGSTSFIIDHATGELVEYSSYQAYGATESDFRPGRWAEFREPVKFTGKEEDIEVGLAYFGARYYSPYLNVWLSPDPVTIHELGSDVNPYAYVYGRPLMGVDPDGRNPILVGIAIAVVVDIVQQQATTGHVNWGFDGVLGAAIIAGVSGGVASGVGNAVLTSTGSQVASGFVGGMAGGAAANLTSQAITGRGSASGFAKAVVTGGIGGLAGGAVGAEAGSSFGGNLAATYAGTAASLTATAAMGEEVTGLTLGLSLGSGLAGTVASSGSAESAPVDTQRSAGAATTARSVEEAELTTLPALEKGTGGWVAEVDGLASHEAARDCRGRGGCSPEELEQLRQVHIDASKIAVEAALMVYGPGGVLKVGGVGWRALQAWRMARAFKAGRIATSASRLSQVARTACFVSGTPVLTSKGYIPIEQINVGDLVWSLDNKSLEWNWKPVVSLLEHDYSGELVEVRVGDETLTATSNHPFCVENIAADARPFPFDIGRDPLKCGSSGHWVAATSLVAEDLLLAQSSARVIRVSRSQQSAVVYNLEVADTHTFTVGTANALVHNKSLANLRVLSKSRINKLGFNAEAFKADIVGTAGGRFNIAVGPGEQVFLTPVRRGAGEAINTGFRLSELPGLFPR